MYDRRLVLNNDCKSFMASREIAYHKTYLGKTGEYNPSFHHMRLKIRIYFSFGRRRNKETIYKTSENRNNSKRKLLSHYVFLFAYK